MNRFPARFIFSRLESCAKIETDGSLVESYIAVLFKIKLYIIVFNLQPVDLKTLASNSSTTSQD